MFEGRDRKLCISQLLLMSIGQYAMIVYIIKQRTRPLPIRLQRQVLQALV
jgi:hypothetical protein